jgi:hypothetical protein
VAKCKRDGCAEEATRAGFCVADYHRDYRSRRRAGVIKPRKIAAKGMTRRERFEHIGYDVMPDGCWRWRGSIVNGYARIGRGNGDNATVASRVAWQIHRGPIASGLFVHHICANRSCVNPDHLQLTSTRENQAEMMQRHYYLNRIAELEAEVATLKAQLNLTRATHVPASAGEVRS